MQQISGISVFTGEVPDKATQTPVAFANNVGLYLDYFDEDFTPDTNTTVDKINILSEEMNIATASVELLSNYRGDYAAGTTYAQGESVTDVGVGYVSKVDSNTGNTPSSSSTQWKEIVLGLIDIKDDTSPELGGDLNGAGHKIYNLTVGVTTGLTLDLSTGNILISTLTTDSTIAFTNIPSGASDWMVEVTTNGYTADWDAEVEWDESTTPPWSNSATDTAHFYTTDGGSTIKGMRVRVG